MYIDAVQYTKQLENTTHSQSNRVCDQAELAALYNLYAIVSKNQHTKAGTAYIAYSHNKLT